jgi:hypothetical protein
MTRHLARTALVAAMTLLALLGGVMGDPWRGPAAVAVLAGWWAALRWNPQRSATR